MPNINEKVKIKNPIINGMKVCTGCGQNKLVSEYKKKGAYDSRLIAKCKQCIKEIEDARRK